MTSKVAKCERIFSNGDEIVRLEIDYQNRLYSLSPVGDGLNWGFKFLGRNIDFVKDDYALLDLMRQAIEFAEKGLRGEEQPDKPQESVKEEKKIETTMGQIHKRYGSKFIEGCCVPNDAKVTIEWTEE